MNQSANDLESPAAVKSAKSDKRRRGSLARIHVEPADNGYMVTSQYDPKGKIYPDPEKNVFADHKSAAAHIASLLAAHAKDEP